MINNISRNSRTTQRDTQPVPPVRARTLSPTVRTSNRTNDVLSTSVPRIYFSMNTQDVVPQQYLPTPFSRPVARAIERNYNNRSDNQAQIPIRRESI